MIDEPDVSFVLVCNYISLKVEASNFVEDLSVGVPLHPEELVVTNYETGEIYTADDSTIAEIIMECVEHLHMKEADQEVMSIDFNDWPDDWYQEF
jgi:hypothetical protein